MAEQPPDKRARPNHPHGASQDWSKVTRAQLPIVLTVAERPNIEQLKRFANSPYGGKTIAELSGDKADDDDEQATYAKKSAREVIAWYIRNISSQKVVFVDYARCVVGAMLVEEGIIANSRIYPISSTLNYPFSITQLPKVIRELAIGDTTTAWSGHSIWDLNHAMEALKMPEQAAHNRTEMHIMTNQETRYIITCNLNNGRRPMRSCITSLRTVVRRCSGNWPCAGVPISACISCMIGHVPEFTHMYWKRMHL